MLLKRSSMVLLGVMALAAGSLWADEWALPSPRVFSAWNGEVALKVIPPKDLRNDAKAKGTLFKLNEDGSEKVVWEHDLVNVPMTVVVENRGKCVVTINTYAHLGYEHALVIYDAKGTVVVDYALEDLLTKEDIQAHVHQSISSRYWITEREAASITLDGEAPFEIVFSWGKTLEINPLTGKIQTKTTSTQAAKP
jgi:hypothetical protein